MNTKCLERIVQLKLRIKELTGEINSCVDELTGLLEGEESSDTGATEEDMGVQKQLKSLFNDK